MCKHIIEQLPIDIPEGNLVVVSFDNGFLQQGRIQYNNLQLDEIRIRCWNSFKVQFLLIKCFLYRRVKP